DEVGRVDKELKKMRNEFNITFDGGGVGGGGGDDTNLLSRLLKNAQDKLNKYAQRVRRSAAEWNSGADSYATSDFNSKTTNKKVTSGKDACLVSTSTGMDHFILEWVKTVLSYAAHASIRKQTTVMAYKKSENDGAFFNYGVGKIKAVVIVTEIGSTIMCFCGRISRIGKAKTFKCSNPRCSGRAICSRGGTGGGENNEGNGDPGAETAIRVVEDREEGEAEGVDEAVEVEAVREMEDQEAAAPNYRLQRSSECIVKGRLEYVVVEEVEMEGRLDEGGIGSTSRQAVNYDQQVDDNPHIFLSCTWPPVELLDTLATYS
ncbi:hypothetical protein HDU79_005702, partial [Rhizoclosmatium sp. JEL0117]